MAKEIMRSCEAAKIAYRVKLALPPDLQDRLSTVIWEAAKRGQDYATFVMDAAAEDHLVGNVCRHLEEKGYDARVNTRNLSEVILGISWGLGEGEE